RAAGFHQLVHRLQSVPRPGFNALKERVIHRDSDVNFLRLVLGHALLERLLVGADDGEVLRRNPVTLRAIAVPTEGDSGLAFLMRRQDNGPTDPASQSFLVDASVNNLVCE